MTHSVTAHIVIRDLGCQDYRVTLQAMQAFTDQRQPQTADEIWFVEHPPVYTRGMSCQLVPFSNNAIEVVDTDRGGQITYHGPGQQMMYTLLDLRRLGIGVRRLVSVLEQSIIAVLTAQGVAAERRAGAPGVYVGGAKIAALGLRVRRGCCYHGLCLNNNPDLAPFAAIDPCGYPDLPVTSLQQLGVRVSAEILQQQLYAHLNSQLGCEL
ncbi:MAG TPA: lipoyl(octanoyl) transferase LipB [Gammaproteobacteria bacterium]|nr:lipoyl(octanoyl) transferase LipB [Gammaproteobacteria bacterium]